MRHWCKSMGPKQKSSGETTKLPKLTRQLGSWWNERINFNIGPWTLSSLKCHVSQGNKLQWQKSAHSPTLGLLLLCGFCSPYGMLSFTLLTMSDVNSQDNNYQLCSQPKQGHAWVLHYACYQDSGPQLYGPNPKHAAFMVSKRMWCQLPGWD